MLSTQTHMELSRALSISAGPTRESTAAFSVLRQAIFDYMIEGEELVEKPFARLIGEKKLMAYSYDGYWACMDTFKERQELEDVFTRGSAPWTVWNNNYLKK